MRIERTKNATRNIVSGVCLKLYQIVVPFIMRTVMIYFLGVQYLGLNSLFTSVLQVLNLAELGVGSAMVYSMYKPIAEDDNKKINALMYLYKIYYRCIGMIIAVIGICILPFIKNLINGEIPSDINVYVLYLFNLAGTVFSYWLFAYKNSLLQAHQRTDIVSKITIIIDTIKYALQLSVLAFFRNYYLYVLVILFTQILNNIVIAIIVTRMYPDYKAEGRLDQEERRSINQRIKDLFTAKVGAVVVNSADTIVISAFLGLTVLAIYQNYFYIISSIMGFVSIIFNSCTAGIGNSIIVETKEKNYNDLKKFTFLICWIAGVGSCCLLNLYQPFMELWMGKELLLEITAVLCFCGYFYIQEVNKLLNTYKDAAGIWHEDRFRPLVVAFVNFSLNVVMVRIWGIYGVLLSTVLATLLVGMPWILHNLFTTIFEKRLLREYVKKVMFYTSISVLVFVVSGYICNFIEFSNLWITLVVRLVFCIIVPNSIFYFVYHKKTEFKESVQLIDKMTKGKIKVLSRFMK